MARPRINMAPGLGEEGPTEPQDPMDALSTFMGGSTPFSMPQPDPTRRNQALVSALRGKYRLGPDDAGVSQSDLEALDRMMRGADVQDKITEASVVPHIQGQTARDVESMKGQYGLQSDVVRGQTARDVANISNIGKIAPAQIKAGTDAFGGGGGGGSNTSGPDAIAYWSQQAMRDASVLTKLPSAMKQAVAMHMAQSGGDVNTITNQTRQMSEAANDLLPMVDRIQNQARDLQSQGLFDVVNSPIRQFLVSHGMGTLLGHGADAADKTGQFQTDLGLLQSGVARAHAGARGAGNTGMAERFEKLMNAGGDLPTFLGELNGVRDLLKIYATHTNPGIGGQDDYANPHYQPR